MSTLTTVDVKLIDAHPDNVRRDATPDPELIASVKAQGILQPIGVIETTYPKRNGSRATLGYLLIAGHRRLAAAKKAGLAEIPVIVYDHLLTRAQQIEAMLVENGRRADLSAVEEAAAYEQLTLEGVTPAAIAKATGRSPATVKARLKLTRLPAAATEALHGHQMTLATAEHILEFADYPQLLEEAEKFLADGKLDEYEARRLAKRINVINEHRALRAKYEKSGLPVVDTMPQHGWYASKEWNRVNSENPKQAAAYYPGDDAGWWNSEPVLLNPLKGGADETPEQVAKRKEREKLERAKFKADQEALELRHQMRLEHVVELGRGLKVDSPLLAHLRVATGKLINSYGPAVIERITKAAGVDDLVIREKNDYAGEALAEAVRANLSDTQVMQLLLACLAQTADNGYTNTRHRADERADANEAAFWHAFIDSGYDLPTEDQKQADKTISKTPE